MSAYLLARVKVTDPAAYAEYVKRTPAVIAQHDGRFVVRGGNSKVLSGPSEDRRLVVIEFPSMERLESFWSSREYATAKSFRIGAAEFEAIAVEGA